MATRHTTASLTILAALVAIPLVAGAQEMSGRDRWADSARREIGEATRAGDLTRLRAARAVLERALTVHRDDPLLQHYQAYALYREATLVLGLGDGTKTRPLLELADELLKRSAEELSMPETHALRASVLGQLIGSSPFRGMILGPRSSGQMDRALELGPRNPRVWLLRGIGAMFMPSAFGGGADRAEEYLRRAIELFPADDPAPPAPAWGHAEAHAWLGQALQKQGRTDEARRTYQRALELEPDYRYVSDVLLPALDRGGR